MPLETFKNHFHGLSTSLDKYFSQLDHFIISGNFKVEIENS